MTEPRMAWIETDFGPFLPSPRAQERLLAIPKTRYGQFDRRYASSRFGIRMVSKALAHCQGRWTAGENGPFMSLTSGPALVAKIRLERSRG